MQGLILNDYLPTVSTNKPAVCIMSGCYTLDCFPAKCFFFVFLEFKMKSKSRPKTDLFCLIGDATKTQLFKDAGPQATDLYRYQLKGCLCSMLIQGHWIVEHSCMLVPIINEVLHFGCISEEKITLDCSGTFPQAHCIIQGTCHHTFVCILLTSIKAANLCTGKYHLWIVF